MASTTVFHLEYPDDEASAGDLEAFQTLLQQGRKVHPFSGLIKAKDIAKNPDADGNVAYQLSLKRNKNENTVTISAILRGLLEYEDDFLTSPPIDKMQVVISCSSYTHYVHFSHENEYGITMGDFLGIIRSAIRDYKERMAYLESDVDEEDYVEGSMVSSVDTLDDIEVLPSFLNYEKQFVVLVEFTEKGMRGGQENKGEMICELAAMLDVRYC